MSELLLMEAALFQLCAGIGDEPEALPLRLSAEVLARAVAEAKEQGLNPARANEIDFALADLEAAVHDAGSPDGLTVPLAMLRADAATLRAAVGLPAAVGAAIAALRTKLRERAVAMERGQYRPEGAPEVPLPHPPEELRAEAERIAELLAEAGFETPFLSQLAGATEELRYHLINDVVDELDAVARS